MREYCCPKCNSKACKRNGYTRHAKQNYRCLACGRQFSLEMNKVAAEEEQGESHEQTAVTISC